MWRNLNAKIPVANDGRDLGAHFNITDRAVGTTLTKRLQAAAAAARRAARLPLSTTQKGRVVRTKLNPMGLYGVESTHASDQALGSYRAAVLDAIGPHTPLRSGAMVFKTCSYGTDLDPDVYVLLQQMFLLQLLPLHFFFVCVLLFLQLHYV